MDAYEDENGDVCYEKDGLRPKRFREGNPDNPEPCTDRVQIEEKNNLVIWDIPGVNDPARLPTEMMSSILTDFCNKIGEGWPLNAIVYVAKATDEKTDHHIAFFTTILCTFLERCKNFDMRNSIIVYTHTDELNVGPRRKVKGKSTANYMHPPNHWKLVYEFSGLSHENYAYPTNDRHIKQGMCTQKEIHAFLDPLLTRGFDEGPIGPVMCVPGVDSRDKERNHIDDVFKSSENVSEIRAAWAIAYHRAIKSDNPKVKETFDTLIAKVAIPCCAWVIESWVKPWINDKTG